MALGEASTEPNFLLAALPPTSGQRRLALVVAAVLFVAFLVTVPFGPMQLPHVSALVPCLLGIFCVNNFVSAVLLFSQFSISRSPALLVLAAGYFFSALIAIPWALSFPGAFSPTGLFGAGLQTAGWLYNFWHLHFSAAVLAYVLLRDAGRANKKTAVSVRLAIGGSVTIVIILVGGLTWLTTAGEKLLPRLFLDLTHYTSLTVYVGAWNILLNAVALALLWIRRRSVLDEWLMVLTVALISEMALVQVFTGTRFSVGFYFGRIFTLITSIVILAVLIADTIKSDARLARSNMMLERERNNKLMNLAAMVASISHEVRQPLMAIVMNGGAALQYLKHAPPDLGEVRSALDAISTNTHRASQIFDNMGCLFKGGDQGREPIDMNEIALGVLHTLREDLKAHGVITRSELGTGLPHVIGHRGQLQEVILNLVQNAIEAMDNTKEQARVLRVTTGRQGSGQIAVTVEDSGLGIDPKKTTSLFDAFVTSKPQGMGLGLAICHAIVERHGGQISAWPSEKQGGALFQFTLPIKSAAGNI